MLHHVSQKGHKYIQQLDKFLAELGEFCETTNFITRTSDVVCVVSEFLRPYMSWISLFSEHKEMKIIVFLKKKI